MNPEMRMVSFMRAHKNMEDGLTNLMHVMTRARIQYQAQINVLSELHGGTENWVFTERDIKNRYSKMIVSMFIIHVDGPKMILTCYSYCNKALFARQEREDDILKLLELFLTM
jgi:hypothetical protein